MNQFINLKFSIRLDNQSIADYCYDLKKRLSKYRTDKQDLLSSMLSLEELLIELQKEYGEDTKVIMSAYRLPTVFSIRVSVPGVPRNVLEPGITIPEGEEAALEYNTYIGSILSSHTDYSYTSGKNRYQLSIPIKPKFSSLTGMLIGIVVGLILGFAGNLLPDRLLAVSDTVLGTIGDVIMNLIKLVVTPLIFCGMVNGVTGCGSVSILSSRGTKLILRFLAVMILFLTLIFGVGYLFFPLPFASGGTGVSMLDFLLDTLRSFFPDNIISPFQNGDGLQVVFIAVLTGGVLLLMGVKVSGAVTFFRDAYDGLLVALGIVSRAIPVFVATVIARMIWGGALGESTQIWKVIAAEIVFFVLVMVIEIILTSIRTGLSLKMLVGAVLPAMVKGALTTSTIAAYPEMREALAGKCKVSEQSVSFGLSMAISLFGLSPLMTMVFPTMFCSYVAGTAVSVQWFISVGIQVLVFAIAAPPMSAGGVIFILNGILLSAGVPAEIMAFGAPLLILLDPLATSARVGFVILELAKSNRKEIRESK